MSRKDSGKKETISLEFNMKIDEAKMKIIPRELTEFEESYGIKFPCKLFNSDGIEIKK